MMNPPDSYRKIDAAVCAVAVLVGLIFFLPHLLIPSLSGGRAYTPFVARGVGSYIIDETHYYAPRIREVTEGKLLSFSAASAEHKNEINITEIHDRIPLYIVALAAFLTGSLARAFMLCDFIFPALCFLVFYMLAAKVAKGRAAPMAAAAAAVILPRCLAFGAFAGPMGFFHYLLQGAGMQPLFFMRLPSPQIVCFFGFGALLLAWKAFENPGRKFLTVAAGASIGLLAYCFIYFATFVPVAIAFMGVVFLLKRDKSRAAQSAWMLAAAAPVMMPFALAYFLMDRSKFSELAPYLHLGGSVFPWHVILILAAIPFLLRALKGRGLAAVVVCSVFIAGLFWDILPRMLPFFPQFKHYEYVIIEPWFVLCAVAGAGAVLQERPLMPPLKKERFFTAALVLLLIFGGLRQAQFSVRNRHNFSLDPALAATMSWLDANIRPDDVIVTFHSNENVLIPVYTKANVFCPTPVSLFLIFSSRNELDDRLMITLALQGVSPADAGILHSWKFDSLGRFALLESGARDAEINGVVRKYEYAGANIVREKLLKKYRADYLLLTPRDALAEYSANKLLSLDNKYAADGYAVYKIVGVK